MTDWNLAGKLGREITFDVCTGCQAFWFDEHKELQLSPGSTLKLMKYIGDHSSGAKPKMGAVLRCPRCPGTLSLAHDLMGSVRFIYWRCGSAHGHFIGFFDFLKEKNFIHPLSPQEIKQLRENVQTINCASCGAPIDLSSSSVCAFCHSPIAMLDMKKQREMLAQLKEAAEPQPVDPTLPFKLALAKQEASSLFPGSDAEWWSDARSGDLVTAGLKAVARWLIT